MTAHPTGPSIVDRRLYGDMADAIFELRSDGRIVARYRDGFRVDSSPEIFSAAQIRGMAIELKHRRQAAAFSRKPDSPRRPMARHEIERNLPAVGNPSAIGESGVRAENEAASGAALAANSESRGGVEIAHTTSPTQGPVVSEPDETRPAVAGCASGTSHAWGNRPDGLAPIPRDHPPESSKSCGGGESRPAETTYSLECGGGAAREEMPASEVTAPASAGRALDAGGETPPRRKPALSSATGRNGDTAGVATGPQDPIPAKCPCGLPAPHAGRCWHKRGMPGPPAKLRRTTLRHRRTLGVTARILALECEVDALKSAISEIRAQLDMGGR